MLGAPLMWDQVVQVGEPCEKRLLAPLWVVKPLYGEGLPLDGVVGLIQQGAGHRHLRIGEHRVPTRLLGLKPMAHTLAIGLPGGVRDVVGKATQALTERKPPQVLALARPVPQGVELRAECFTHWRCDGHQFLRELEEGVAQARAYAYSRKQCPQTLGRAVEAIRQDASHAIRWLLLGRRALEHLIQHGKGGRPGLRRRAQVPEDTATDIGKYTLIVNTAQLVVHWRR